MDVKPEAQENKESIPARRVHRPEDVVKPGDFFFWHVDYKDGKPHSGFCKLWLPGDTKAGDSIPFQLGESPSDKHTWGWNGDFDKPSFYPSIWHRGVWHGYMKAGFLESC